MGPNKPCGLNMKLNDEFLLEQDNYNFIIIKLTPFEAHTSGDKEYPAGFSESRTYYPTIQSALTRMVQKGIVTDNITSILDSINKSIEAISNIKQK